MTSAVITAAPSTTTLAPKRRTMGGMAKTDSTIPSGCSAAL